MKIAIIEDEIPAQIQLERLIATCCPDFEIVAKIPSVKAAVEWLQTAGPDLLFMDVELSDGLCFDIFSRTPVKAAVIITTAYDTYAVKAFRTNCLDYLLKPIGKDDFCNAVEKCRQWLSRRSAAGLDVAALRQILSPETYKQRFTVKIGDRIIILNTCDAAYFLAEDKATYFIAHNRKKYLLDLPLDAIEEQLDPNEFFRLTRACIANIKAIDVVSKYFNSRLKITLNPPCNETILVSRIRIPLFMRWLEGGNE